MLSLAKSIQFVGKGLPKVISPRAHAIADYSTALAFLAGSALFWKRNKRAAVASLICGAAGAGVLALREHPGGLGSSAPMHKTIDFGLASMVAAMPEFMAFDDEPETRFFRLQSAVIAGIAVLTDFEEQPGEERKAG